MTSTIAASISALVKKPTEKTLATHAGKRLGSVTRSSLYHDIMATVARLSGRKSKKIPPSISSPIVSGDSRRQSAESKESVATNVPISADSPRASIGSETTLVEVEVKPTPSHRPCVTPEERREVFLQIKDIAPKRVWRRVNQLKRTEYGAFATLRKAWRKRFGAKADYEAERSKFFGNPCQTATTNKLEHCFFVLESEALDGNEVYGKPDRLKRLGAIAHHLNDDLSYSEFFDAASPDDVAAAVKRYYRELPRPIFSDAELRVLSAICCVQNEELRAELFRLTMAVMPQDTLPHLKMLLAHLHKLLPLPKEDSMAAYKLANVFSPNVIKNPMLAEVEMAKCVLAQLIRLSPLL